MEHPAAYSQTSLIPCRPQATVVHRLHEPRQEYGHFTETTRAPLDARLDLASLLGCQASETSLAQIAIDRDRIIYLLQVAPWLGSSFAEQDEEATLERQPQLEQAVVGEFANVLQVALIYSDRFRSEYTFSIFVRGDRYSDVLMDALLDRELRLVKRFAPRPITFHYLPYVPGAFRRELIRQAARLIFED